MRRALLITIVCCLALPATAQLDIFQKKPRPFLHPEGYYLVAMPRGWEGQLQADGSFAASASRGRDQGKLTIRMASVERDVDTELVALNAHRELRKLPHFKDGGGGRLKVGGKPASIRSFEFDYMGNTEYTISVEELYVVSGTVLFVVHFEVMKRSLRHYALDLSIIYDSMRVAEIDATGKPTRPVRLPKRTGGSAIMPGVGK
jgi:hypothetical protein